MSTSMSMSNHCHSGFTMTFECFWKLIVQVSVVLRRTVGVGGGD